jgi:hypothetical protein
LSSPRITRVCPLYVPQHVFLFKRVGYNLEVIPPVE